MALFQTVILGTTEDTVELQLIAVTVQGLSGRPFTATTDAMCEFGTTFADELKCDT